MVVTGIVFFGVVIAIITFGLSLVFGMISNNFKAEDIPVVALFVILAVSLMM